MAIGMGHLPHVRDQPRTWFRPPVLAQQAGVVKQIGGALRMRAGAIQHLLCFCRVQLPAFCQRVHQVFLLVFVDVAIGARYLVEKCQGSASQIFFTGAGLTGIAKQFFQQFTHQLLPAAGLPVSPGHR